MVIYDLPLNEVVFDFYDRLKSVSRGYALRLQIEDYEVGDLVKMSSWSMTSPSTPCPCWSTASAPRPRPRHVREAEGPDPPHMFKIPIQAAIGGRSSPAKRSAPCART
jgi:GTP-binding protein LepA